MSSSKPGVSLSFFQQVHRGRVNLSPEIEGQIDAVLQDLLQDIPAYGVLKLELISHGGVIKRVKATKEVQTELRS